MGKLSNSITIGADPELIVLDKSNDSLVPAWKITSGVKHQHEIVITNKRQLGLEIHADGVALEYNFSPTTVSDFANRSNQAVSFITKMADSKGFKVVTGSEMDGYSTEDLMHPLARMEGCDPDFDAYSENPGRPRLNRPPGLIKEGTKCFGGHIHIGYPTDIIPPWALVRMLDGLFYLSNVVHDPQGDRRKWYGQAGIFRPKPYGVEYRTPSNYWVRNTVLASTISTSIGRIFDGLETAPTEVNKWFRDADWKQVKEVIDSNNTTACLNLYEKMFYEFEHAVEKRM